VRVYKLYLFIYKRAQWSAKDESVAPEKAIIAEFLLWSGEQSILELRPSQDNLGVDVLYLVSSRI